MEGQEIKMLHDFVGNFLYVAYLEYTNYYVDIYLTYIPY